jgi:hypothetical protein
MRGRCAREEVVMRTSRQTLPAVAAGVGLLLAVVVAPTHAGAMDMTGMRSMMPSASSTHSVPSPIAAIEARVQAQLAALGLGRMP